MLFRATTPSVSESCFDWRWSTSALAIALCRSVSCCQPGLRANPVRDDIVSVLASAAGGQTPELSFGGPAEALSLIGYAATAVLNGDIDEVVVGAVDSFMHWTLLDRLAIAGRLLFDGNAYGAVPGEAACLVHLVAGTTTAPGSARDRPGARGVPGPGDGKRVAAANHRRAGPGGCVPASERIRLRGPPFERYEWGALAGRRVRLRS